MSDTPHTPGPWRLHYYGPDDTWLRDNKGEALADIGFNSSEREANARLIAAAPDLLSAAYALLATSDDTGCSDDLVVTSANALEQLRDAVAKAEGREP